MGNRIQRIRKWYRVPAKRGLVVREAVPLEQRLEIGDRTKTGYILSSDGQYVYVRSYQDGKRRGYHPFDLDYSETMHPAKWVGEIEWVRGHALLKEHNAWIDSVNARWNAKPG